MNPDVGYTDKSAGSAVMPMRLGMMAGARRAYASHSEVLLEKKAALEAELDRVNKALIALKEHPEIENVMNLVQQALY